MSDNRAAYWADRLTAMGGGYLPKLVAQLLEEIPGVGPLPPVRVLHVPTGWLMSLATAPDVTSGQGPSPAAAGGDLLAKVERQTHDVSPDGAGAP